MKKLIIGMTLFLFLASTTSIFAFGSDPDDQSGFKIKPTLQVVTPSSIGIMWKTYNSDTATIDISVNSNFSGAVTHSVATNAKTHKVTLSGLTASTRYYYRVFSDGAYNQTGSFVTALTKGSILPFRFIVYGDSRRAVWYEDIIAKYGDNDDHVPTLQSMMEKSPDFLLHVGDFVYSGTDMGEIYNFFDVEKDILANYALLSTYGNHEFKGGNTEANSYMDNYLIPAANSGKFDYYSYNYGNVHILVLNTGEGVWATDNYDLLKPGSTQWNWAKQDLESARADSDIEHIFVSLHAAPYSCANFGDNSKLIAYLESLMIENQVKIVFMGHEHDYQHLSKNNIHYVLSGGCGSSIMDFPWKGDQNDTSALLHKYDNVLNYVIVDIDGASINIEARKVQGNGNSSSSVLETFSL
jgi:predicted phosphodiesterase